jgi:hypothetical protein
MAASRKPELTQLDEPGVYQSFLFNSSTHALLTKPSSFYECSDLRQPLLLRTTLWPCLATLSHLEVLVPSLIQVYTGCHGLSAQTHSQAQPRARNKTLRHHLW